jgi:arylsulfatase A-like enzyme/tetratricopeptide (TPR) repeat protein
MARLSWPAKRRGLLWLTALPLIGGLGSWACGRGAPERNTPVILISIDTCRADHLGCYGRTPSPTPTLDALAGEGLLFEETVTPVPMTLPAHCSMLTGTTPLRHGVHDNMAYRLGDDQITLAERLRDQGYATGAILGAFVLDARFGLSQGFSWYDDAIEGSSGDEVIIQSERRATAVTDRACAWVDANAARPFFLFVHYYDPHWPYTPPAAEAARFPGEPYVGEIAYTDAEIGRLLQHLRDRGLYERALIVVAGDHGESLGDHGEKLHGYFVYQSTLRVPLIVRPPRAGSRGAQAQRIAVRAGLIDVVPTILGYLGLPAGDGIEGRDLGQAAAGIGAAGESDARDFYCESLTPTTYGCSPLLGLVSGDWKLIDSSNPELYGLADDPREQRDRAGEYPARVEEMRTRLLDLVAGRNQGGATEERQVTDEKTRQRLQSLGYIAGRAVEEDFRLDRTRPNPRDLVGYHEALETVLDRVGHRDLGGARELCEQLLRVHPEIPDALILLGDIASQQGDLPGAAAQYQAYLDREEAREPGGADAGEAAAGGTQLSNRYRAHYNLANALASLRRPREAEEHYREALRLNPHHLDAHVNLGLVLAEAGRLDEAITLFREALALQPALPDTRMDLAQALALRGALAEALQEYQTVLETQPGRIEAWMSRGDLLERMGRGPEAVQSFTEAVRLKPEDPAGHIRLARTLLAQGRGSEAMAAYRRGMEQTPAWADVARDLVWVLATHEDARVRNGAEAVRICTRLVQEVGDRDPAILELLAASYAEQGRFADAVRWQERALGLVQGGSSEEARAVAMMESRLRQYRAGQPLRNQFSVE